MTKPGNRRTEIFFDAVMSAVGLVIVAMPLAVWVAWTETVFFLVLAAGFVASALFCALAWLAPQSHVEQPAAAERRTVPPERSVAELQRLFPLIYDHRHPGDPAFQRKMERLRKLLWD